MRRLWPPQTLLEDEAEARHPYKVELAKDGNPAVLRLCLERLLPPRKDRPINFALPKVEDAADLPKALLAILEAVAQGEITPGEGQALTAMLGTYEKGLEIAEWEGRLKAFGNFPW
jgi:hypothetical protein